MPSTRESQGLRCSGRTAAAVSTPFLTSSVYSSFRSGKEMPSTMSLPAA